MFKPAIALFFSFLFVTMLSLPTIDLFLDSGYDVSMILDSCDEEEKEGKESSKDKDVKILQVFMNNLNGFDPYLASNPFFYSKTCPCSYLTIVLPPPEHGFTA